MVKSNVAQESGTKKKKLFQNKESQYVFCIQNLEHSK
jgi:hypothetical protein